MICSVISINLIKQTKLWEILTQTWDFSWMEMVMLKSIIQKYLVENNSCKGRHS